MGKINWFILLFFVKKMLWHQLAFFCYLHQQFTVLTIYLCTLDTTIWTLNTWYSNRAAVTIFSIHKFITGRIGRLRERTGFGYGMDFICNIIIDEVRCGRFGGLGIIVQNDHIHNNITNKIHLITKPVLSRSQPIRLVINLWMEKIDLLLQLSWIYKVARG